jgi:hypothetical protein
MRWVDVKMQENNMRFKAFALSPFMQQKHLAHAEGLRLKN